MRQQLIELLAHVEVNIDYPEHDVEDVTSEFIRANCNSVAATSRKLVNSGE